MTNKTEATKPKKSGRGGLRNPPGGRPTNASKGIASRMKCSPTLRPKQDGIPSTMELCKIIQEIDELPGWGYVIDKLVLEEARKRGLVE